MKKRKHSVLYTHRQGKKPERDKRIVAWQTALVSMDATLSRCATISHHNTRKLLHCLAEVETVPYSELREKIQAYITLAEFTRDELQKGVERLEEVDRIL